MKETIFEYKPQDFVPVIGLFTWGYRNSGMTGRWIEPWDRDTRESNDVNGYTYLGYQFSTTFFGSMFLLAKCAGL